MKKTRYALLWDELDGGVFIGTPAEIAKKYCEVNGADFEVKMDVCEEDGETIEAGQAYFVDGELIDYLGDNIEPGNAAGNLETAYEMYFDYEIESRDGADLYICELATPAQEAAFTLGIDDILGKITALEARDEGLDLDDEAAIRFWYWENKAV